MTSRAESLILAIILLLDCLLDKGDMTACHIATHCTKTNKMSTEEVNGDFSFQNPRGLIVDVPWTVLETGLNKLL